MTTSTHTNAVHRSFLEQVWFWLTRPVVWGLLALIFVYQKVLSPVLGPRCRFYPSCSSYAAEAITVHGPFKGVALGAWRIARCHPWNSGGIDMVPQRGSWRPGPDPTDEPAGGGAPAENRSDLTLITQTQRSAGRHPKS